MEHKISKLSIAVAAAITLSACGGGGSSEGTTGPVQAGGVVITAMDGYIQNALLCADANNDGVCQPEEAIKNTDGEYLLTDKDGKIDAKISLADQELLAKHPRLIATIQSIDPDSTIQTIDTDLPNQAMKSVTLRAPAGSDIISPITDLVVAKMKPADSETDGLSKEEAEKAVLASLAGLNGDAALEDTSLIYGDYIADKNANGDTAELAAKIHKTAQILTETKANAASDDAFDAQLDHVVTTTVDATKALTESELEDNTYKPYVPVAEEPSDAPIIVNTAVTFDDAIVQELAGQVANLQDVFGDADMWGNDRTITMTQPLVKDADATASGKTNSISIANDSELRKNNLQISFANNELTISRVNAEQSIAAGSYSIQLATNDLDKDGNVVSAKGKPVLVTSKTTLTLNVKSYNYAPQVDSEAATELAKSISAIKLEQHAPVSAAFELMDLFTDKNNDALTLTVKTSAIPGIVAEIHGTQLTITGAPTIASTAGKLIVTATDGEHKVEQQFSFSEVTPVINSDLRDMLVGADKTWYRWNQENTSVLGDHANCMAFKFVEGANNTSGKILFAEGTTCPAESDITNEFDTWSVNELGHFIWGSGMTMTSMIDNTADSRQPRIIALETFTSAKVSRAANDTVTMNTDKITSGTTLFQGIESATNYWNDSEGSVWYNGEDTSVNATSLHGQFSEHEQNEHIDVDLYFNGVTCESLGFVKDTGNTEHNGYKPGVLRAAYFQLMAKGTHSSDFTYGTQMGMQPVYAFQSSNIDDPYCAINLDINAAQAAKADFHAGQALTIYVSEKENSGDEEFIINTFIDRDETIEPKADLTVDEAGIYFVDGLTVGHLKKNADGKVVELSADYNGSIWTDFLPMDGNGGKQIITPYQASNGNTAYQFWFKGQSDTESFTIWSDDEQTMMFKDAGEDNQAYPSGAIYATAAEAQQAVEDAVNKGISFVGTTWRETFTTDGSESFDYAELTYTETGVSVVEVTGGVAGTAEFWEYDATDTDLPCRDTAPNDCSYNELNADYSYEGENVRWTWDPSNPDVITREKGRHESVWKKLK